MYTRTDVYKLFFFKKNKNSTQMSFHSKRHYYIDFLPALTFTDIILLAQITYFLKTKCESKQNVAKNSQQIKMTSSLLLRWYQLLDVPRNYVFMDICPTRNICFQDTFIALVQSYVQSSTDCLRVRFPVGLDICFFFM